MEKLLAARGCFYHVELGDGAPYYTLDPDINDSSDSPILIQSSPRAIKDITSPVPCLNNIKVFYTFGQQFGSMELRGTILLGPAGDLKAGEKTVEEYFQQNRSSISGKTIKLSRSVGGDPATPFFLTDFRIGSLDVTMHTLEFRLIGTIVEPRK